MLASALERKIHDILKRAGIPFEEEYEFEDLVTSNGRHLRFDFAIFDDEGELDCLIEAQGRQHYVAVPKFGGSKGLYRQRYNDDLKKRYCLNNRIRLVTIPYFDENKINYDYIIRLINGY